MATGSAGFSQSGSAGFASSGSPSAAAKRAAEQERQRAAARRASQPSSGGSSGGGSGDIYAGLSGEDRNVYDVVRKQLADWGIGGLADDVLGWLQEDRSPEWINLEIQNTAEFKKRFPAIANWGGVGSPPTPAEYLSLEEQYRTIMVDAGLNPKFFDSASDFTKYIQNGVSPSEIQGRVEVATSAVNNLDPNVKSVISQWYTPGDFVAYALGVPADKIEQQYTTAQIGAAQLNSGFEANRQIAERLTTLGIDYNSAQVGLEKARALQDEANKLGGLYGGERLSDEDVAGVVFEQDAEGLQRVRGLASKERATFSGSSGFSDNTLLSRRVGQS
jgi:hypothetical protein